MANRRPRCCTLPHVLALATKPIASILELMATDQEKEKKVVSSSSSTSHYQSGRTETAGEGIHLQEKPILSPPRFYGL